MVGYVSALFVGGGKAFSASFGLSPTAGVLITALIALAYTIMGGFLAVSLSDAVQACFMIVALVVVPVIAILDRGGLLAVVGELRAFDPTHVDPLALSAGAIIGFLGIGSTVYCLLFTAYCLPLTSPPIVAPPRPPAHFSLLCSE